MTVEERLIVAAAELSSASNPDRWREFMEALKALAEVRRNDCVRAQVDRVQVAQGRAQEILDMIDRLASCRTVAERVKKGRP